MTAPGRVRLSRCWTFISQPQRTSLAFSLPRSGRPSLPSGGHGWGHRMRGRRRHRPPASREVFRVGTRPDRAGSRVRAAVGIPPQPSTSPAPGPEIHPHAACACNRYRCPGLRQGQESKGRGRIPISVEENVPRCWGWCSWKATRRSEGRTFVLIVHPANTTAHAGQIVADPGSAFVRCRVCRMSGARATVGQ